MERAHLFGTQRLGHIREAIEPVRLTRVRYRVGEVTSWLYQCLVGKNLLFQFLRSLVAARVIEFSSFGSIRPERCKQIILAVGDTDPEVAVVRSDNDRHHRLMPRRQRYIRHLDHKLAIANGAREPTDMLDGRYRSDFLRRRYPLDQLARRTARSAFNAAGPSAVIPSERAYSVATFSASASSAIGNTVARAVGTPGDCIMARWNRPRDNGDVR
jgi:hypothetical protein